MKNNTQKNHHRYLLLSLLLLLFTVAMAMLLVFIERKMENFDANGFLNPALFLPLLLALPVPLAVTILYQLFKLLRERFQQKAGSRIRLQLTFFFVILTFISAAPQAFLSVNLVRIMLNTWYSSGSNIALNRALDLAISYHSEHVKQLEATANNDDTFINWPMSHKNEELFFKNNPHISSVQIFNRSVTLFYGDSRLKMGYQNIASFENGLLLMEPLEGLSFIAYKLDRTISGIPSVIIITSVLADGFNQTANLLMQQEESARLYSRFAFALKSGLAFFYLLFSLPLALLAILSGFLFSAELVKPVTELEAATQKVAQGDYTVRLKQVESNELSALMGAFNNMMDELELSRVQGSKIEKMAAWGEIAQRMAHEVKNPLTPIKLSAQRIQKKSRENNLDTTMVDHSMQIIVDEVDSLTAMVDQFRSLAHSRQLNINQENLLKVVSDAIDLYRHAYPSVNFNVDINDETIIAIDHKMIHQVLINLFKNSIEAMGVSGVITVTSQPVKRHGQQFEQLTVVDTGEGFKDDELSHIFVPYFSSKTDGAGLGLAVVQKIIFEHNGRISAANNSPHGAIFTIELPYDRLD